MDKYEFNMKVEQIRKMTAEGDYVTAMKIADSIDWSRVRNANLLSMIAGVYEKNGEYQEAKDILLLAFERAPVGKRLLFKLAELSVRSGDIEEAEDFYREFTDLAPEDSRAFLLEYLILKAKGAPATQLIHSLEQYTSQELDERWLYELAELYARADMGNECVKLCDKITLLFGRGQYSEKALLLKQHFVGLSDYQRSLLQNDGAEKAAYGGEPALAQGDENGGEAFGQAPEQGTADQGSHAEAVLEQPDAALSDGQELSGTASGTAQEASAEDALAEARYADEDAEFEAYLKAHRMDMEDGATAQAETAASEEEAGLGDAFAGQLSQEVEQMASEESEQEADSEMEKTRVLDDAVKERLRKIVIHADEAKAEISRTVDAAAAKAGAMAQAAEIAGAVAAKTAEPPRPQARVEFSHTEPVKEAEEAQEAAEKAGSAEAAGKETAHKNTAAPAADSRAQGAGRQQAEARMRANAEKVAKNGPFHMIVEAETAEDGLAIAIDELKYIHNEYGITNAAAKTTAEKLNAKGLSAAALEKLKGRDFIIEHAGTMKEEVAETVCELLKHDDTGMIIVLVDTPEGLDQLEETCPEVYDLCDLVSDEAEEEASGAEETGSGAEGASSEEAGEEETAGEEMAEAEDAAYEEDEPEEDEPYMEEPDEAYDEEYEDGYDEAAYQDGAGEEDAEDWEDGAGTAQEKNARKSEDRPRGSRGAKTSARTEKQSVLKTPAVSDHEEMEIDDFAQYCCQYASSIDCSITGKSMLALYERIELMEEDNIPLTKETAEDLIEEAADRAEKPPIGKRIKGMFNSKYDKNGLLILREEDFIH